jgi:hypothetical protein
MITITFCAPHTLSTTTMLALFPQEAYQFVIGSLPNAQQPAAEPSVQCNADHPKHIVKVQVVSFFLVNYSWPTCRGLEVVGSKLHHPVLANTNVFG